MTSFLYPFLDEPQVTDPSDLLADLARSADMKRTESHDLARSTVEANATELHEAAALLRAAGQILVAGNGGSACDAERLARLLRGSPLRVRSLVADSATLTALANDIGVEHIFSRQVQAYGKPGDVLVVVSTSGNSANLLTACDAATRHGLRTVALAGYRGGQMADHPSIDICLRVDSASVHRTQEAQAVLIDRLVTLLTGEGKPT